MRRSESDGYEACLVIERHGVHLDMGDDSMRSHPGMGLVRLRRLVRGEEHDPLLDLAGVKAGDTVLDATFGFGQDALVFAYGVGNTGRVIALESSPLVLALAFSGMRHWPEPATLVVPRIDLRLADAGQFLAAAPSKSVDVVYFDPMFRDPRLAAPDFKLLRAMADPSPIRSEDVLNARRVARRLVLFKDAWPGREIGRLGVRPVESRRSAEITFGTLDPL